MVRSKADIVTAVGVLSIFSSTMIIIVINLTNSFCRPSDSCVYNVGFPDFAIILMIAGMLLTFIGLCCGAGQGETSKGDSE